MNELTKRDAMMSALAGSVLVAAGTTMASAGQGEGRAMPPVKTVRVKDVEIGAGAPKTIVSIAEKTGAAAADRGRQLADNAAVDIVEYRVDHLEAARDTAAVVATIAPVVTAVGRKPLLVTFRTKAEGGETAIADGPYLAFYKAVLDAGLGDLIDLQVDCLKGTAAQALRAQARVAGKPVILSHHDFGGTPSTSAMVALIRRMRALDGDILKIAVMPKDPGDVLRLLDATWQTRSRHSDRPLITMAMGGVGAISRMSGEVFGSAATFGDVGTASAPGQIGVEPLKDVLAVVHKALGV